SGWHDPALGHPAGCAAIWSVVCWHPLPRFLAPGAGRLRRSGVPAAGDRRPAVDRAHGSPTAGAARQPSRAVARALMAPLLAVDGISRRFGGVQAVDHASFEVEAGSITGLIGPNGAGKTTAFNLISGFLKVQSGTVSFDGKAIHKSPSHAIAR